MAVKILMFLLCATFVVGAPSASECNSDELAVYRVFLDTHWSRELFPKQYPEWRPPAGWSKLIGRTHDESFWLYREGEMASAGLQLFAEKGQSDGLESTDDGGVYDEFTAPPVPRGEGRTTADFFLDGNHSMVSVAARVVPSPDWFIGVDSLNLCRSGHWIDSIAIQVDPMDAGTDNGFTFTAPNWPSEPKAPVARITSKEPHHPANSFFYPDLDQLPPIATFTFVKSVRIQAQKRTPYESLMWESVANCSANLSAKNTTTTAAGTANTNGIILTAECRFNGSLGLSFSGNETFACSKALVDNCTWGESSNLTCTEFGASTNVTHLDCVQNVSCSHEDCVLLHCSEDNDTSLPNITMLRCSPSPAVLNTSLHNVSQISRYLCTIPDSAQVKEVNRSTTKANTPAGEHRPDNCMRKEAISTRSALYFSPTPEQLPPGLPTLHEQDIDDVDDILEERVYHLSVEARNATQPRDPTEGVDLSNDVGAGPLGLDATRRTKSRRSKKASRYAKACHVSEWSAWSPCSVSCGVGDATRTRRILAHPRRGGKPCPALEEKRWCGGHSECPQNFFNW